MIVRRPRFQGMGFTYYDLLGAAGQENCDPKDSACVARNQQRANAVEDLWISEYMKDPNTANLPTPNIHIAVDTSPAATAAFMANQPVEGQAYVQTGDTYQYVAPPVAASAPVAKTAAPKRVVNSSGGQNAPPVLSPNTATPATAGFSFSSLPWWAWAGGGLFALMVLREKG